MVQDFWSRSISDSLHFQAQRLEVWKTLHAKQNQRGPMASSDESLREDYFESLKTIIPTHQDTYSYTLDRFLHIIRAQKSTLLSPNNPSDPTDSTPHYSGSSPFYADMYTGAYSSMETTMSAAEGQGTQVKKDIQMNNEAGEILNNLMKFARGE